MSQNTNPTKSRLWVDGDAHRAPAGTAMPTTNLFTAATFTNWDAFGAIKAGFEVTAAQDTANLTVWNGKGAYRKKKGEVVKSVALRPVDESKATVLTLLQGGSIVETVADSGVWEWVKGDDEEFALLLICRDPGHGSKVYYAERATLDSIPTEAINDDDLAGWDLVATFLEPDGGGEPVRTFTDSNPLAPAAPAAP